uniref:Uncharacterized protein n=1 Tax=Sphaerodactylus townsendi TaxID=933632 RepID=A0ACB8F213_9SAUR
MGRSRTPEKGRPVVKTGAVVIETGTGTCKAGFAGQQTPQSVIGTLVGHCTEKSMRTRRNRPDTFIGEKARLEPDLDIILPVRHGIIIDWDAAEVLWRHLFYDHLKVAPEDHPLLMSDPPLCPTTNREKLVEVVFESLHSPGMYVAYQSVLSVYAHGIHGMAQRSLRKIPEETRKEMYENVMLCGGSSLFEGLEKRFSHELLANLQSNTKEGVVVDMTDQGA